MSGNIGANPITYQAVCANHYRTLNNGTMTNTGIRADNNFTCSFTCNTNTVTKKNSAIGECQNCWG